MEEEKTENHEEKTQEKTSKKNLTSQVRENPWMLSTIVLVVLVLVFIIQGVNPTGSAVSEDEALNKISSFLESQDIPNPEIGEISSVGDSLYVSNISVQGQVVPLYMTQDGDYLVQGLIPLNKVLEDSEKNSNEDEEVRAQGVSIPKSDKPKVELFVMTHCPYGAQSEKGFIPVMKTLQERADIKIRFVHYFMHDPEKTETPRQVCIREEQSDKFLDYLECFLEDGDSERCISKTKINRAKLNSCISSGKAEEYYAEDSELSKDYGVKGSPTLVLNSKIVSSSRNSQAYLNTICQAFNNAPEECSVELSSKNPSLGFGWEGTGSSTTAQC